MDAQRIIFLSRKYLEVTDNVEQPLSLEMTSLTRVSYAKQTFFCVLHA